MKFIQRTFDNLFLARTYSRNRIDGFKFSGFPGCSVYVNWDSTYFRIHWNT